VEAALNLRHGRFSARWRGGDRVALKCPELGELSPQFPDYLGVGQPRSFPACSPGGADRDRRAQDGVRDSVTGSLKRVAHWFKNQRGLTIPSTIVKYPASA
jgi:hypothetical protein